MNISHITSSVTMQGGGIPVVLQELSCAQDAGGSRVSVIGHEDGGTPIEGWVSGGVSGLRIVSRLGMDWAGEMSHEVIESEADVLHVHGLWAQSSILAPRLSMQMKVPYLVSPHGMLDAWALKNSRLKKVLAGCIFEQKNLKRAGCIHALCGAEASAVRAYGLNNKISIIPNGVSLPGSLEQKGDTSKNELLFLGRIHPKKGLVNALKAWAQFPHQASWRFIIAGWDQGGHEDDLIQLCDDVGVATAKVPIDEYLASPDADHGGASVVFVGSAFGADKEALLKRSAAFILPSFSEGLPMSVLEAWAYGLPVLMTEQCNLPEGFAEEAAVEIDVSVEGIGLGLRSLLTDSNAADRQEMGRRGRALVEKRFTWRKVAEQMQDVYAWLIGGGSAPSSVMD